ncbi:MAG TPA: hypothetical protein VF970_01200 [Gemmatimonadales bacterium]
MTSRMAGPEPGGEGERARRPAAIRPADAPRSGVAGRMIRLLLDDPQTHPRDIDWDVATGMVVRNGILLRVAAALKRRGWTIPARLAGLAERARLRADRIFGLTSQIGQACERRGIPHAFLKVAEHYPDAGPNVGLLVAASAVAPEQAILDHVPALPAPDLVRSRLTGSSTYLVPAFDTTVIMHRGRLGRLGEHTGLADMVLRGRRHTRVGFFTASAPAREDQLLLQATRWTYGQNSLRLSDLYWTIATVRGAALRWSAVLAAAEATGLLAGLSCHLAYVEQIYREIAGGTLLPEDLRQRIEDRSWGPLEFRETGYRQSGRRISGPVYMPQLRSRIAAGDWKAAGRLCLLPILAFATRLRHLVRFRREE